MKLKNLLSQLEENISGLEDEIMAEKEVAEEYNCDGNLNPTKIGGSITSKKKKKEEYKEKK